MDDDDLVLAVLGGDPKASDVLARRIYAAIQTCFPSRLGEADAEDLAQRTLMVVFRKLPEFKVRTGQPIRRWARGIARREVQEELRQRHRRARLANGLAQAWRSPSTNISSRLARLELEAIERGLLYEALDRLPSHYRRVLDNDLQSGDINEFARREGIDRGTVRTRRRRALGMLDVIVRELRGSAPTPPKT